MSVPVSVLRFGMSVRKSKNPLIIRAFSGAPSGFRTPDPLIKSQLLYQLS